MIEARGSARRAWSLRSVFVGSKQGGVPGRSEPDECATRDPLRGAEAGAFIGWRGWVSAVSETFAVKSSFGPTGFGPTGSCQDIGQPGKLTAGVRTKRTAREADLCVPLRPQARRSPTPCERRRPRGRQSTSCLRGTVLRPDMTPLVSTGGSVVSLKPLS
jgi:hypothetical protein